MILHIHLLTGEALKGLAPVLADSFAAELGAAVAPARAFWLSSRAGRYNHGFLRQPAQDRRVALFAETLLRDFGRQRSPLLIAPGLDPEDHDFPATEGDHEPAAEPSGPADQTQALRNWTLILAEIQAVIAAGGGEARFLLRSLALPPVLSFEEAQARLLALQNRLTEAGIAAALPERAVVEPAPDSPIAAAIRRNRRAQTLMEALVAAGAREGIALSAPGLLLAWCDQHLERWEAMGLRPDLQDPDLLARRAEQILRQVL